MRPILLLIVLVLLLSGPWYPYSREWGYAPIGGGGIILVVILLILLLTGHL